MPRCPGKLHSPPSLLVSVVVLALLLFLFCVTLTVAPLMGWPVVAFTTTMRSSLPFSPDDDGCDWVSTRTSLTK